MRRKTMYHKITPVVREHIRDLHPIFYKFHQGMVIGDEIRVGHGIIITKEKNQILTFRSPTLTYEQVLEYLEEVKIK
jgi:hypothetical protein